MIRSFKDKMKVKQEAYQAEQERLAIIEEQKRKEREWELFDLEQKAIAEKNQQILVEEEARQHAEYLQWKQEQRILQEQQEQAPAKPINTGIGMGHDATWKLTWMSFSTHPKIIDLPMSEKIRLFKIAESQENDRMNQPVVLGSSTEALVNYALSFSGDRSGATDSYATTTFNPDDYQLWNGFTLSFWVRPDEEMDQQATILGSKANDPTARFHIGFPGTAGKMEVGIGSSPKVVGINNPMEVGNWYNIVLSYTGTQFDAGERKLRMWINTDARMASNNNISWANQDEGMTMYFGGRNTDQTPGHKYTQGFACALDEVAIYNRCIDSDGTFANEVYNGGTSYDHLTNGQSGLVGYWKFNEGSGTTITDHSGNGNHGTFGAISGDTTAHPIWINR